jgi:hypothetical protein
MIVRPNCWLSTEVLTRTVCRFPYLRLCKTVLFKCNDNFVLNTPLNFLWCDFFNQRTGENSVSFISFSSLSYDRSKASSKASAPHSAIQSFLIQMRVSSAFLKVVQLLFTSSSLSSCHFYPPWYLSFNNPL